MECIWDSTLPVELQAPVLQSANPTEYLERITQSSLDPRFTHLILAHCEALLPHICAILRKHGSLAAALATLGRIVPFAPSMLTYVERLLSQEGYVFARSDSSVADDLLYLLGLFRLFAYDPRTMRGYVKPDKITPLLQHPHRPIVYLTIRILQIYLSGADHWFEEMVRQYMGSDTAEDGINGQWDDIDIDYRFLTLWEEERFEKVVKLMDDTRTRIAQTPARAHRIIPEDSFDPSTALIAGVLMPCNASMSDSRFAADDQVVLTPATLSNLGELASALKTTQPILLRGLTGCGKTSLVRHVARRLGTLDDMVTLHLNEQSDAKSLIGIYTTGDTPASFVWKAGVLTTAVQEGRWILIENLDRAPHEIIGTLLPLIEKRELLIASRKQTIHAAQSFRIIATVRSTTNHRGEETYPLAAMIGERHWRSVSMKTAPAAELQDIAGQLHPSLEPLLPQFLTLYQRLKSNGPRASLIGQSKTGMLRVISPRDLFKWCGRVSKLLQPGSTFTSTVMDEIYLSAIDCFAGALPEGPGRVEMTAVIAEDLHIDPQRRDYLLQDRDVRFEVQKDRLIVGQYQLPRMSSKQRLEVAHSTFSTSPHTTRMLHRVAAAVANREPLLLIGETGVGKTTAVQHLADAVGKKLVPFNLSQQSEAGDLLGGFKPVNIRSLIVPLKDRFDELFSASFNPRKNQQFLEFFTKHYRKGNWTVVCKIWRQALKMVDEQHQHSLSRDGEKPSKKRKIDAQPIDFNQWDAFKNDLLDLERRLAAGEQAFAFQFIEGGIVKAARNGDWVLLDEINLASPDTLEAIADLFDSKAPSILLAEAGNIERIDAHPDFRVFAAMNPATDVGKKDLPPGIRTSFTELYVESPDRDIKSLQSIVRSYLRHESTTDPAVALDTSTLYQTLIRLRDENKLVDGAAQMAHFSLRTLTRTLSYAKYVAPFCNLRRALYEGFQMSFLTLLDSESARLVQPLLEQHLLGKRSNIKAELGKALRQPNDGHKYSQGFPGSKHWIRCGQLDAQDQPHYILTPFVRTNLENLVRAASTRQFPVLIQGPTSSGKTSMIEYLAKRTGHKFVRINNHEHTDLQEYLGTYVSDSDGQLHFQEGLLVQALRHGHWIVLDELNLAPTDVLEALNRLLDDNRELLIPETQEVIRPHSDFMLFATQNPAGLYGGRKVLSRAFRNRFLELHFDDIPVDELQEILHRRTQLPESRCRKIVTVYRELSTLRQEGRMFEQKSFATLRDLFRWASRSNDTTQQLAENGFMLLAERVRKPEERQTLREVIERVLSLKGPRVSIDETSLYSRTCGEILKYERIADDKDVVWTKAMRRLYVLVSRAIQNDEPVLLVGNTGCGKTTVCQMLARAIQKELSTVNAHQTTETADLIGSQRPVRNRAVIEADLRHQLLSMSSLRDLNATETESTDALLGAYDRSVASMPSSQRNAHIQSNAHVEMQATRTRYKALFEWVDGPLIHAMKAGSFFLLDEISLADDSVLERINSVLESQRSILLAEKGSLDSFVVASTDFQLFATMNPGGDYGKKELSPALRNRFTEIWVPPLHDADDIEAIVSAKLDQSAVPFTKPMVAFAQWFNERYNPSANTSISVRDVLTWANAVNPLASGDLQTALVHGAAMVYIDTLGANPAGVMALSQRTIDQERVASLQKLGQLLGFDAEVIYSYPIDIGITTHMLNAGPFRLQRIASSMSTDAQFSFQPRTTRINAMRVIRAMQLSKPILLEGSPGVGKTALVTAIAQAIGMPLTRINLSEQTDLLDLFGSDVPVENGQLGTFAWQDAPFLRAMKAGEWVLLDEMNLASQSVLEGLNSCLDHRGEVFVPELGQTFRRHPEFRLFAAQNPHHQGGGRKGLPASFVNRFTVVFADAFRSDDLVLICQQLFPGLELALIRNAVHFLEALENEVSHNKRIGTNGAPWEFNLRDLIRWLSLVSSSHDLLQAGSSRDFVEMLFLQRFRSDSDRKAVLDLFYRYFKDDGNASDLFPSLSSRNLQVGLGLLPRNSEIATLKRFVPPAVSSVTDFHILQSLMVCVEQRWPVILTGSSGSGKTSLIENLASTVGASVVTIAVNAETDAMDLVGGFDQADTLRNASASMHQLRERLQSRLRANLIERQVQQSMAALVILENTEVVGMDEAQLTAVGNALENAGISDALKKLTEIQRSGTTSDKARFEWFDGMLVEALQDGKWLILDNTNLCSPSVLDRLNSLLEADGMLIVNEHSSADGTPRLIRPHPSFRIFMTLDPRYGELSRAMRNRAVEIHLSQRHEQVTSARHAGIGSESFIGRFRTCKVLAHLPQEVEQRSVQHILRDHLGVHDVGLMPRVERQLAAGLYGAIPAMQDVLTSPLRSHLMMDISRFYESVLGQLQAPADLAYVQTLHPLNNQALVQSSPQILDQAYTLALLYDTNVKLAAVEDVCGAVDQNSGIVAKLHRLERSLGFPSTGPQSRSSAALGLVRNIIKGLREPLENETYVSSSILITTRKIVTQLSAFCAILLDTIKNRILDPPHLVALLLAGRHLANSIPNHDFFKSLLTQLQEGKSPLAIMARFKSGRACFPIWQALRPSTATTKDQFEDLLRFEAAVARFDAMCHRLESPLPFLIDLRLETSRALNLSISDTHHLRNLCEKFEGSLSMPAEEEGPPSRRPHFYHIHRSLCEHFSILVLDDKIEVPRRDLASLALLGLYPTKGAVDSHTISGVRSFNLLASGMSNLRDAADSGPDGHGPSEHLLGRLGKTEQVGLGAYPLLQTELQTLGKTIASKAHLLLADELGPLNTCLRALLTEVLQASAASHDEASIQTLAAQALLVLVREADDATIAETTQSLTQLAIDSHSDIDARLPARLHELILYLRAVSHATEIEGAVMRCARAWTTFACISLRLYVPEIAMDPALVAMANREVHDKQHQDVWSQLRALNLFRLAWTGTTSRRRAKILEEELAELGVGPPVCQIYRPGVSQIPEMQGDFKALIRLSDQVWESLETQNDFLLDEGSVQNIVKLRTRLVQKYRPYDDFKLPIVGFIDCLLTGQRLASRAMRSELEPSVSNRLAALSPFAGATIHTWLSDDAFIRANATSLTQSEALFWLTLVSSRSITRPIKECSQDLQSAVQGRFHQFYTQWRRDLAEDHRKAAAQSSLYKFKGDNDDQEPTQEELDEYFASGETEQDDEVKSSREDEAHVIASLHDAIFSERKADCLAIVALIRRLPRIIAPSSRWSESQDDLPAMIAALNDRILAASGGGHGEDYDLYKDANVKEVKNLLEVLNKTSRRFKEVNQAWPEHATPIDILRLSDHLREISHCAPLPRSLPKIEELHFTIYEWQKIASREYSAADLFEELTSLIVSWRQLELSSWAGLFRREKQACENAAASWWYVAYEAIVAGFLGSELSVIEIRRNLEGLLKTLGDFLGSCGLGEFAARLRMLRAFEAQLSALSGEVGQVDLVSQAIHNLIAYYANFENTVQETLAKKQGVLEKDMQNIIQIASWKDRNIDVLRQSAQSSHKKLLRLVRKYRRLLAESVSPMIEGDFPDRAKELQGHDFQAHQENSSLVYGSFAPDVSDNVAWSDRPERLRNAPRTAGMAAGQVDELFHKFTAVNNLGSFSEELRSSIAELQAATPKTLTEANRTLVNHLKTRKRRLLADVLKDLRRMGFQSAMAQQAVAEQASTSIVLARLPKLDCGKISHAVSAAQHQFHRLLSLVPKARLSARKPSEDLTRAEVDRCSTLLESLLQTAITQYETLSKQVTDLDSLRVVADQVIALASCEDALVTTADHDMHRILLAQASGLSLALQLGCHMLQLQQQLNGNDYSDLITFLGGKATVLSQLQEDGAAILKFPHNIGIGAETSIQASLQTLSLELDDVLKKAVLLHPEILPVTLQLAKWTGIDQHAARPSGVNGHHEVDLSAWTQDIVATFESLLDSLPQATSSLVNATEKDDGRAWVLNEQQTLIQMLQTLNLEGAKDSIGRYASRIQYLQGSHEDGFIPILNICRTLQPIQDAYIRTAKGLLDISARYLGQLSQTGHMLATSFIHLADQGFCSPSSQSADDDKQKQTAEAGTGLGDGEGGEDISKDIGDDEDLSEAAQGQKPEKTGDEIEDEKDAVDMADEEMEGEMGDSVQEDEEDGDEGASDVEEGAGMEEEPTNDDNETSADKTWDGDPGEDHEKPGTESSKDGKKQDELSAAREAGSKSPEQEDGADEDMEDEVGAGEEEIERQMDEQMEESLDQQTQHEQPLDLPEDINFGDNKSEASEESDGDLTETGEPEGAEPDSLPEDIDTSMQEEGGDDEEQDETQEASADMPDLDDEQDAGQSEDTNILMADQPDVQDAEDADGTDAIGAARTEHDVERDDIPLNEQDIENDNGDSQQEAAEKGQSTVGGQDGTESNARPQYQQDTAQGEDHSALKQLGDALKEWYRQREAIQAAGDQSDKGPSNEREDNMTNARFEHVPEDSPGDTQALGAASAAQSAPLNEEMALSKDENNIEDFSDTSEIPQDQDQQMDHNAAVMEEEDNVPDQKADQQQVDHPTRSNGPGDVTQDDVEMADDILLSDSESLEDDDELQQSGDISEDSHSAMEEHDAYEAWAGYEENTKNLAFVLTERLRLILQPTQATKLRGDFRTGKRLNIKRIIPYIASSYKRDKIWMRRSVPSKRSYQIMLAIDDSKSMSESQNRHLAFETLALITKSMSMLEVGELSVVSFGEDFKLVQDFSQQYTTDTAVETLKQFTFSRNKTNVLRLLRGSLDQFRQARLKATSSARDLWQLQLIISDGICEDHPSIRQLVRQAHEERIMIVFIVVDAAQQGESTPQSKGKQSILDLQTADFFEDDAGETQLKMVKYLDTFPFNYYLIVRDVTELPGVLAGALQQWFAEVTNIGS